MDERGYLQTYAENLFRPLSEMALTSFEKGSGSELVGRDGAPAKMRALHSSSALAVNFFDYWSNDPDGMLAALGLRIGAESLGFEVKFPTGLGGTPPNLDVAIRWSDGAWLGIESKFTEWLSPKSPGAQHFKDKYFPPDGGLWASRGMVKCQGVAEAIYSKQLTYRHLDAPQLLKHALGLGCSGERFELLYAFYDAPGPESEVHAKETADFASRIAGDFPFHVRRYGELISEFTSNAGADYVDYLSRRYGC